MSHCGHYADSAPSGNPEHQPNTWRSIGDLAREIAERLK